MSNIFIGLKKTCLGVLERGERGKDSETGLKEKKVIKSNIPLEETVIDDWEDLL